MKNLGDFTAGKTIICRFNTHKADGTPITLAGTPAVSVYKNSTTQSTTGVTLTVDYDSVTGLHHVAVDTSSDGTFYAAGNDFDIVVTTGTVDSVSVVGTVVGTFSLANRSALRPATADRTILVDAAGKTTDAVQTGDSFSRIGAAGEGLTALGDTRLAKLDANVSTRSSHSAADVLTEFSGKIGAASLVSGFGWPLKLLWEDASANSTGELTLDSGVYANSSATGTDVQTLSWLNNQLIVTLADTSQYVAAVTNPLLLCTGYSSFSYDSGPTTDADIRINANYAQTSQRTLTSGERSSIAAAVWAATISSVSGVATTMGGAVAQTWRRFFKKATKSATQIQTFADDGTTPITTQAISVSGDDETQGAAT